MAASSLLASVEYARDFQYFGNENHPVKLTKAKVSLTPVVDGKLIKFNLSAVNSGQVILGGEIMSYFSLSGVHMDSQNFDLAPFCPISVGDFVLKFCQVIPVDVTPGCYTLKLELLNQDGRKLTCVAFEFTIPFDSTIQYPEIA